MPAPDAPSLPVRVLRSPSPRLALLLALLGVAGWLAATRGAEIVAAARSWAASLAGVGWVAFVGVYVLATMLVFPDALLARRLAPT